MKKNKDTKPNSRWQYWRQSPPSLKTLFFGFILSIILILAVVILIHRQVNKTKHSPDFIVHTVLNSEQASVPATVPEPTPVPASVPEEIPSSPTSSSALLQNEIALQNSRLDQLEGKVNQVVSVSQSSHQLIAFQLLQEILDGHLSIGELHRFLQIYHEKTSQPWTINILNAISGIQGCKTYAELEAMLVLPSRSPTQWQSLKSILKSFVKMRKLDDEGHYVVANREDIKMALRAHNIQQALESFKKLSADEQAKLSTWKQDAEGRLLLETTKKKLLLDLAAGNQS